MVYLCVRYVITKFSQMDSLPNFLTHGAPLCARFARARSSATNLLLFCPSRCLPTTSAIILVVVIIPFYAPRSIKSNNENSKKKKDYTRFYVFVSQSKFNGTNPKQVPLFVLLGNPVYGRWFLDGSDQGVRLVAVIHI